jgi:hypothetical protein
VGQRRRILERPVRVRHQAKLRQPPTAPRANEANVACCGTRRCQCKEDAQPRGATT